MGHGQIAGAYRKGNIILRLGQPLEEDHAGGLLGVGGLCHGHTGPLLDSEFLAVGKMGRRQDFQGDAVALGVAQHYPRRKIGGAGAGADVGQNVADLNIVAAEAAAGGEAALDVGHIVVVPQPAGGGLGQLHGHPAALDVEEGVSQLLCADEHIVRHRVAAKQGLAVVGRFGLGVRPVVIGFGSPDQPLDGLKVGVLCAGGVGKGLPVGVVQE